MNIKVMLVDDSAVMRKIILKNLRQVGFEIQNVIEAENGKVALDKYNSKDVDIIISDLHMPEMDGYEFAKTLRLTDRNIPILLVTAEGSREKIDLARDCGINAFLNKPPTPEELYSKIIPLLEE